jgi:hypothetical protein
LPPPARPVILRAVPKPIDGGAMRHAFALLGVFAAVLLVYSRVADPTFITPDGMAVVPGPPSADEPDPVEPDGDAEAEYAVLAHLGETMGHTFCDGTRMEITSIDGHTLNGVTFIGPGPGADRQKVAYPYAHRAVIRVSPASGQVTLELWLGVGLGPTGPADSQMTIPLSEFVPGL